MRLPQGLYLMVLVTNFGYHHRVDLQKSTTKINVWYTRDEGLQNGFSNLTSHGQFFFYTSLDMPATNDTSYEPGTTTNTMHTLYLGPSATVEGMPPEVMTMIVSCVEKVPKPAWKTTYELPNDHFEHIIESEDLFSLRLTSNRIRDTTWYGFVVRYFTTRKHMLSRHSLQALLDISNHTVLRHCVRKIIIGPERVNSNFYVNFEYPRDLYDTWREVERPYHDLVDEQEEFEATKQPTCMLRTIFKNLKNFNDICIETAEEEDAALKHKYFDWTHSWGSKSILQKSGRDDLGDDTWPGPHSVLVSRRTIQVPFSVS
jgi:hypothetical protein